MVSEANLDHQHESRSYRITIGVITFCFLLLVRYALAKVAGRLTRIRQNVRGWTRPLIIGIGLLVICFFVVLIVINIRGKHEQRKQHRQQVGYTEEQ